mmetsp:Transcript_1103/g.2297  ORF Transcript_1103/g.2297 Transcript_1103/m.2297 type:complete len:938 (-) Transcript_1103:62-2875(-)|eukprot:CAMPEP_0172298750 /NCGR_PEP_ID=MMETSP1058-20130122/1262_1 /TAXON_ID=83371 /ORGANISM="Detonula confervacea, Strain CCMP 353" /LENGTH=937 /DNA_ID=CAMNT_0013008039 /DNA_START=65 /DNA_END=2878 /DNA_ORIENTATION=-
MAFSLSFAGVQVRISPSASNSNANFSVSSVRHCDDGRIEADVCNFSGTIIISGEESLEIHEPTSREVVVDAVPEPEELDSPLVANTSYKIEHESSFRTANSSIPDEPYVPPISHQSSQLTVEIDSEDDEEKKIDSPNIDNHGRVRFSKNPQIIHETKPKIDLSLHKACASEDAEIDDLRETLKSKPELASVVDEYGDYVAHVFANNHSFIFTSSDYDVQQFAFELYTAYPRAFLEEGYDGQVPFAGTICDWVDDCHQLYARNKGEVYRVSEIRTLTKSSRVINSLCVREEVQKLMSLPTQVSLPPKVLYSFKMLSFILDTLSQSAFQDISTRREFWAVSSKRRDKIISSVASVPFIVRTILLIENKTERDALIDLSIVRNLIFRPESVDLWLVALLSGDERARDCATLYLCLISRISLSGLFGRRMDWSGSDSKRFHSMRASLYREVGKLEGFLPCMLHLGDSLYEVATRRAVKYAVESTIGRPLPVYLMFMEMCLLLILMTSYRIIVELVYAFPSEQFLSQYRELWGLSLSIAVFFASRDVSIMVSFSTTEEKLALRYARGFGNMIGFLTIASAIIVLSILYVNNNVEGRNYVGIVAGLLWWKFLLHVKGMSQNLSTLIYTIIQIASALKYFLAIFLIAIFFFADMIDIVKKTSGDCNDVDGAMDSSLETFCSLTPLQTYLAMYGVMIGGMEISSLEGTSALVSLLFVAASFCGVIVLVNILIAIVTGEYEKARARSCHLFARARLEAAARQVAREKIGNPPDDPTSGIGRKLWRLTGKLKLLTTTVVVEYFLVKSLISCTSLHKDGILGDFLYIALVLCAILYHLFVVAANMYLGGRAICNYESLRWLRGSKFHRGILKICLVPVCRYLKSVGLGKGESCPDGSDTNEEDRPLLHNEFFGKQADFANNMVEAIKASETRILHSMKSMVMLQIPPE